MRAYPVLIQVISSNGIIAERKNRQDQALVIDRGHRVQLLEEDHNVLISATPNQKRAKMTLKHRTCSYPFAASGNQRRFRAQGRETAATRNGQARPWSSSSQSL